jgi:hypothetical protein
MRRFAVGRAGLVVCTVASAVLAALAAVRTVAAQQDPGDGTVIIPPVSANPPKADDPKPDAIPPTQPPGQIPDSPPPPMIQPAEPAAPPPLDIAALEKEIESSINKGVEWLKKQQKEDGSFGSSGPGPTYGGTGNAYDNKPGIAALCLLALLKSEVPPSDPVITRGFKYLYDHVGQKGNKISTYEMGVTLMAVEALYEGTVKAMLKKSGKKVEERPGDFKEPKYTPSPNDAQFCVDLLKRLYKNQTKEGGWRYGEGFAIVGSDEDISATQIVMLGIKSASRMKLPVDPTCVRRAMGFVLRSQVVDGPKVPRPTDFKPDDRSTYASSGDDRARGWAYEKKSDHAHELAVTGSMTTAGIATLLICKSILAPQLNKKETAEVDQAIWDGFAWLSQNWSVVQNPGTTRSVLYYLYGIERVGTLGLYKQIGTHSWFVEGASVLVRAQTPTGCWDTKREVNPSDIFDTCFALLFLRRGTVPVGDILRRVYTGKSAPPVGETKAK